MCIQKYSNPHLAPSDSYNFVEVELQPPKVLRPNPAVSIPNNHSSLARSRALQSHRVNMFQHLGPRKHPLRARLIGQVTSPSHSLIAKPAYVKPRLSTAVVSLQHFPRSVAAFKAWLAALYYFFSFLFFFHCYRWLLANISIMPRRFPNSHHFTLLSASLCQPVLHWSINRSTDCCQSSPSILCTPNNLNHHFQCQLGRSN